MAAPTQGNLPILTPVLERGQGSLSFRARCDSAKQKSMRLRRKMTLRSVSCALWFEIRVVSDTQLEQARSTVCCMVVRRTFVFTTGAQVSVRCDKARTDFGGCGCFGNRECGTCGALVSAIGRRAWRTGNTGFGAVVMYCILVVVARAEM